jgi:hypothetical protein
MKSAMRRDVDGAVSKYMHAVSTVRPRRTVQLAQQPPWRKPCRGPQYDQVSPVTVVWTQ